MKAILYGTFVAILVAMASASSMAATFSFGEDEAKVKTGEIFEAAVLLDTGSETINAVEGRISFSEKSVDLEELRDGNSIVSLWIEKPHLTQPGEMFFSALFPGGYSGAQGELFVILFRAVEGGRSDVGFLTVRALLHDGRGTEGTVVTVPLRVHVSDAFPTSTRLHSGPDTFPPESFTPEISRDPSVFGNQYFIAFATTDKGIGMDHYEVMEIRDGRSASGVNQWQRAESPYLLLDQTLQSDIYVRAVDARGNFLIVKLPARFSSSPRILDWGALLFGTGVAFVILLLVVWRSLRLRHGRAR
jgi:hypothetical protein